MVIPEYDFILVCHSSICDEAGFNKLIYDMLPTMSDKKLKADKSFNLKDAISGYAIKRPFEGTSVSKVTMTTRRYQMEENASGIRLFSFASMLQETAILHLLLQVPYITSRLVSTAGCMG